MSETLGKFVIDLEARVEKLETDLGRGARIAQRRAKEMQAAFDGAAKNILGAFGGIAAGIGAGIGAGAFVGFIKSSIDAQDEAIKLAQKIGVATDSVAGLSSAASKAGVEASAFQSGMAKLAKGASEAGAGIKDQAAAYAAMGINVKDAQGGLKSTDVLLGELSDKFAGYRDGTEKTALAVKLFGKSGADMIPLLNGGSRAIEEQIQLAKDLGAAIGTDAAKGAEQFNDTMSDINLAAKGVGNQLATALLPALNQLATSAIQFLKSDTWRSWMTSVSRGTKTIADNIDGIIAATKLLGTVAATVYAGSLIKNGLQYAFTLAQQLGGINKLIVAQGEWGKATAASFQSAYKQIGALGIAFSVVGAALVGWQVGTYLREQFRIVADAGDYLVFGIAQGWEELKRATAVVWEGIKLAALEAIDLILEGFASMLKGIASAADVEVFGKRLFGGATDGLARLAKGMSDALTPAKDFDDALAAINAKYLEGSAGNAAMLADMQDATAATFAAKEATKGAAESTAALGAAALVTAPNVAGIADAADKAAKNALKLSEAQAKFRAENEKMAGDLAGKMAQAQAEYKAGIDEAARALLKGETTVKDFHERQRLLAAQLNKTTAELKRQGDVLGNYQRQAKDDAAMLGLSDRSREIEEAVRRQTEEWHRNTEAKVENLQTLAEMQAGVRETAGRLYDLKTATEASRKAADEWSSIWSSGLDRFITATAQFITRSIKSFSDFKRAMVDNIRQMVTDMLVQWARTKVIGWLSGAGGGGGWAGLAAGVAGAAGLGGSSNASAGGSATEAATQAALNFATSSNGGGISLMDPSSWMNAGKNFWSGMQTAWYGSGQTTQLGSYMGTAQYGPGMATTYAPSTFGTALGVAGGAYAGYNRWQNSNKDFGGGLGAAAYGIGTVGAIGAVGGMMAGAGAAAGMAGGMASIGLAAIPVVGWIALAAMAVDMLSGGKLFGTKGKLHHSNLTMDVGAEGASLAQSYTLKGQKAFFGGTKWTTKGVEASDEAKQAAREFYDALKKNRDEFTKQFNAEAGALVGGSFKAEFDKKGNLTSSSSVVHGIEYKNETQEQFAERLVAENMLDVLGQFDAKLAEMIGSYRSSVESLTQFASAAAMAQSVFQAGGEFLALGANQSLSAVLRLAEGMIASGESIEQTVQRLVQAQAQYDQFVAQFKPPTIYVDDYQASLAGIYDQMQANLKQANDLARAAGAESAATKDLINIHAYAAKQFAAARAQLEASAKGLAYSMGLIDAYTLDQVNSEIASLQGKLDSASSSVSDFGGAITDAANRANEAINLLLGNLSPLNDNKKLSLAMEGLRAGTVSQEQVLEIGRRLYASSQKYVDLFAEVQRYPGRVNAGGGGGYSYGGSSSATFTGADQVRLDELYKKQAEMLAAQDYANAQILAQQIAELAATDGVDFNEVIGKWGLSASELAERLHLDNTDALAEWIANAQAQTDSNEQNTSILKDAIEKIGRDIVLAIIETNDPGNRNSQGGKMTKEDAELLGSAIARGFGNIANGFPIGNRRNERAFAP